MNYYISVKLPLGIDEAVARVSATLAEEGFGVLMDLNIQETLRAKTGTDVGGYRVLGACNPGFARQAIASEPAIGTLLPCNILVRDAGGGMTEIDAVDPVASMQAVQNPDLSALAADVRSRLQAALDRAAVE
jgi:uncharacterized protein (DUF302 family)